MKYFLLLLILLAPCFLFADDDKNDDHNTLPVGFLTAQQILDGLSVYHQRYEDYNPDTAAVQVLHDVPEAAEIKVVFGDWCSDSRKYVPAFLKVMEKAQNQKIQVLFLNVDTKKKEPADLLADLNVDTVPTFIVSMGGEEIGRLVETPSTTVEADLAKIISSNSH